MLPHVEHTVRVATLHDMLEIMYIQQAAYPSWLREGEGALASIVGCGLSLVCVDRFDMVVGYVLCYPLQKRGHVNPLGMCLGVDEAVGYGSGMYTVHDLAVSPISQGQDLGLLLLETLLNNLRCGDPAFLGLQAVAVNGSWGFWERRGFVLAASQDDAIASYGPGALLLERLEAAEEQKE